MHAIPSTCSALPGASVARGGFPVFQSDTVAPTDTLGRPDSLGELADSLMLGADSLELSTDTLMLSTDTLGLPADTGVRADTAGGLEAKIISKAEQSITYYLRDKYTVLRGNAYIEYLDITLNAEYIRINNVTKEIYARGFTDSLGRYYGRPKMVQAGQEITADSLKYNFDTRRAYAWNSLTAEGEGFIRGGKSKVDEHRVAYIQDGIYTTCNNPSHPHFGIRLYKTKVKENQIITGPANLFIEGIPLPVGVPFGFFPKTQKRASGIIFPSLREDASLGFSAENFGYYLGLSDHFDLSVLGEMYSLGSYGIRASSRYSWRYRFNGNFSFDYLRRKFPNDATGGYSLGKQFNIRWSHSQSNRGTGTNFSANVNAGSSKYYQNTTDFNLQDKARNTLASGINYSKTWLNSPFSLSASANHSQDVSTGQVSIGLPTLSFNVSRITPFDSKNRVGAQKWYHRIGMSYSMQADNRVTTGDSILFSPQTLDKLQTGIRHSIPVSTSFNLFKYFFVSPSFNYNERWYFKSFRKYFDPGVDRLVTDTVSGFQTSRDYSLSLGMNTRIFGMLNFKKGKIKAIRHVITPSIGFSYRPDFGEEKYGYYRYYVNERGERTRYSIFDGTLYGGPAAGVSKSLNFSIDNIIEMKVRAQNDTADGEEDGEKKVKLLDRLSINGGYNFADKLFPLSNINFSGSTTLFEKISMSFNGSFDPYAVIDGQREPIYLLKHNNKLARLTRFSFSVRGSLNSRGEGNTSGQPISPVAGLDPSMQEQLYLVDPNPEAFVDFNLLWSLSFGYSFNFSNPGTYAPGSAGPVKRTTQALDVNGDFSLTPKWKIGFQTSYDFERNEVGSTSLSIFRDLHCWALSFSWIPFGSYRSYSMDLRVNAAVLQDLKLTKRRNYYNF